MHTEISLNEEVKNHPNHFIDYYSENPLILGEVQEKHISITTPIDSRSNSPTLTTLINNNSTEGEKSNHNQPHPLKVAIGYTSSPKTDPAAVITSSNEYNNNVNELKKSSLFLHNPEGTKVKTVPLGKRALLKKLSEGTLVRRHSERHSISANSRDDDLQRDNELLTKIPAKPLSRKSSSILSRKKINSHLFPIEILDIEALRRYRKAYKLSIHPSATKSSLMKVVQEHYLNMKPDTNQVISQFLYLIQAERKK